MVSKYSNILMTAVLLVTVLLASTLVGFTAAKDSDSSSIENINLTVTGCNVTIKTLSGNVVNASAAKDGFRYEIDETVHKLTATQNGATMTIELESTGKPNEDSTNMATIFIPEQQYSKVTVVGNNAGVSLPSLNADYNLVNNNGAMSVCVSKEFSKTIDFNNTSGSGSLVLSSSADNYTLNMTGETSAISISPELPKYTFQPNYKYVKGNGKAVINLNIAKSAFAIVVDDIDGDKMNVEGVDFPFEAADVVSVSAAHYTSVSAEEKIVTEAADIQALYAYFESLTLQEKEVDEKADAAITTFQFHLSDDKEFDLTYAGYGIKCGGLKSSAGDFEYFTEADVGGYWINLPYEAAAVKAPESAGR